jgi:hypothetical protein
MQVLVLRVVVCIIGTDQGVDLLICNDAVRGMILQSSNSSVRERGSSVAVT